MLLTLREFVQLLCLTLENGSKLEKILSGKVCVTPNTLKIVKTGVKIAFVLP